MLTLSTSSLKSINISISTLFYTNNWKIAVILLILNIKKNWFLTVRHDGFHYVRVVAEWFTFFQLWNHFFCLRPNHPKWPRIVLKSEMRAIYLWHSLFLDALSYHSWKVIDFLCLFCSYLQLFCNSITVLLVVVINRGPEFWYLFTCQCVCVIHYSDDTILPRLRPKFGNPLCRWYVLLSWWINGNRTLWRTTNVFCGVFFTRFRELQCLWIRPLNTHEQQSSFPPHCHL